MLSQLVRRISSYSVVGLAVMITAAAVSAETHTVKKVKFQTGKSSASFTGAIKGYDTYAYEMEAKKGQTISAALKTRSNSLYMSVASKRTDSAVSLDPPSFDVTKWTGKLPEDGTYLVKVYLVRASARRGARAAYSLTVSIK